METATLSKTEAAHVERMAGAFAEPTMEEQFKEWAPRVLSHEKQEKKEKEKNAGPREVKLEDRPDEEKKFLAAVGEKNESEKASPAKGSAGKDAASESNDSPVEPLSGDRHWQALEGKVAITKEEANAHWDHVGSRAGVALDYVNKSPEKAQIEQGLRGFFDTNTPGGQAFFRDFSTVLAEVPNPGEVLHHIALRSEDRNWLRTNVKNWKELRTAIQTISKHYAGSASQASPKPRAPRAPKPPSELSGRGSAGDDGLRGESDFTSFSAKMNERYLR